MGSFDCIVTTVDLGDSNYVPGCNNWDYFTFDLGINTNFVKIMVTDLWQTEQSGNIYGWAEIRIFGCPSGLFIQMQISMGTIFLHGCVFCLFLLHTILSPDTKTTNTE